MKRLPKLTTRRIISALIVITISIISQLFISPTKPKQNIQTPPSATIPVATTSAIARVIRVIDGDTIEIDTKQKVRYIGIDTPELHDPRRPVECFAKEAAEINKKLVEGKTVRLEKDVSETDRFGRLLRYVYVSTDASPSGQFVNEYLLKEGFGNAATFPPDVKYADIFTKAQDEAKNNNKGLWNKCL